MSNNREAIREVIGVLVVVTILAVFGWIGMSIAYGCDDPADHENPEVTCPTTTTTSNPATTTTLPTTTTLTSTPATTTTSTFPTITNPPPSLAPPTTLSPPPVGGIPAGGGSTATEFVSDGFNWLVWFGIVAWAVVVVAVARRVRRSRWMRR